MRWWVLVAVMLVAGMVRAQDSDAVYAEALRRIEAARASGDTELSLIGLDLTQLPPEVTTLTHLESLILTGNRLTTLPPEIGTLTQLHTLNVASNRLTALPPEIGALTNLQVLNISHNQLTTLPPEIEKLRALVRFNVYNNQLTTLPPEVRALHRLQRLYVEKNTDITYPPPEVIARGQRVTLAYLRAPSPYPPYEADADLWLVLGGFLLGVFLVLRLAPAYLRRLGGASRSQ